MPPVFYGVGAGGCCACNLNETAGCETVYNCNVLLKVRHMQITGRPQHFRYRPKTELS